MKESTQTKTITDTWNFLLGRLNGGFIDVDEAIYKAFQLENI